MLGSTLLLGIERGQGIGLTWSGMIADDFEAGQIEPVTDLVHIDPHRGYWEAAPSRSAEAMRFRNWLLDATQEHR